METKKRIIETTFELFSTKGANFSLNEVASAVGIKKASIYAHFENKDTLLTEIINQEMKEYFFEINQENDDLEKIFFGVLDYYKESHLKLLFWKRLLLFPSETIDASITDKVQEMSENRYKIVRSLISKNMDQGIIKKGNPEVIGITFFSMIHGILSSVLIYHPMELEKHYKDIWEIFWRGIKE